MSYQAFRMARPLLPGVAPDATALLAAPGPAGQGRKRGRAPRRPAGGASQRGSGRDSNRPPQPRAFRHRVHHAGGTGGGTDDDGGGPGNRAAHGGSNYPGRTPDLRSTAFFSAPPPAIPPRTGDSYNASSGGGGGGKESSKESMVRNGSRTVGAGPRAPTGESSLPTPHRRLRWTAPVSPMSATGGGGEGGGGEGGEGGGGAGRTQDSATITPGFPPARETGSRRRSSALGDDERRELVDWLKGELKRCGRERERWFWLYANLPPRLPCCVWTSGVV